MKYFRPIIYVSLILFVSSARAEKDEWLVFDVPSICKFEHPPSLKARAGGGEGESKWLYSFEDETNQITLEVAGFHHIPETLRKPNEDTLSFLQRTLSEKYGKALIRIERGKTWLRVESESKKNKVLERFYVPSDSANGASIRSLRVEYRESMMEMVKRIEKSWTIMK